MNVDETELSPGSENTSSFKVVVTGMRARFFLHMYNGSTFRTIFKRFRFLRKVSWYSIDAVTLLDFDYNSIMSNSCRAEALMRRTVT